METKQCAGKCGLIKNIDEFPMRGDHSGRNRKCKKCISDYAKQYRKQIDKELKEYKKAYYEENNKSILRDKKLYYEKNKGQILENAKKRYEKKKEELKLEHREYYANNKRHILENKKVYREKNKDRILRNSNEYRRARRLTDPSFALRNDLSTLIARALRYNGGSKMGKSILQCLPYTIEKLKKHLEKQFESWMTWKNHGKYNSDMWDDNDPATWTWQLDHIVPHSTFRYISMQEQSFKDCWALNNLRPLNSKQNFLDGASKVRHK